MKESQGGVREFAVTPFSVAMHERRNSETGAIDQCEVVEARHVEDSIGYPCERTSKQECADCGAAICDLHAEFCDLCRKVFCGSCLFQHTKEPHKPAVPILDERTQKRFA